MKKATMFTPELFPAPTPENLAKYGANAKLGLFFEYLSIKLLILL